MELDNKISRKNPFTVPEIVVQPNSPVPGLPDPSHLAQSVPLGPSAFGTGLYQPSLSSMTKYQYKTPALPTSQTAPSTQYRTLSGVLSNNLKKNWVTPAAAPASQSQRKIDQAEIDARLKSLMDRLSSQQSLLKPAEKPSAQMQHYLQSTTSSQTRKLSDSSISASRNLSGSSVSPQRKLSEATPSPVTKTSDLKLKEEESSSTAAEEVKDIETEDTESDSSEDSESVTTELDEEEINNVELQVPEIKINLAEAEDLSPEETPEKVKCDIKCDKEDIADSDLKEGGEKEKRKEPVRRASLLKTVVSIKSDTPVTVVNYTQADQDGQDHTPVKTDITDTDPEDSFQTPKINDSQDIGESFTTAVNTSSSLVEEREVNGFEEEAVECCNDNVVIPNGVSTASKEEEEEEEKEECGTLVVVSHNAEPQQNGENETSTDCVEQEAEKQENGADLVDIYKMTDSREKKEKMSEYNQQHSNMIHDLIIGKTKQRRSRQPRVIAPTSTVPLPPPQDPSPKTELKGLETFGDFQMIDDEDGVKSREKSLSRSVRSNSISRSLRESSTSRSMREGSPKITLPPTPLTNPEKYGISRREQEKSKSRGKGSILSLISPTESITSNDMDYHLDGLNSDSSGPVSPTKSGGSTQSPVHQVGKKSKGFMAAVAGIFRGSNSASPSPVTSPSHESKVAKAARKESKSREDELLLRTASLSLKASHPSTPPVPLSRRVKLGTSGPPQASEDSFSDEEEEGKDRSLSAFVKESSKTGLPKQIFERLEKRMSKSGKRAAKQATSVRVRRAQEIQREMEEVEVQIVTVEERGVGLEQELRKQESECGGEMMQQWFKLLGDKNKLVRREQELMVEAKQLELEDQSEKLESELAGGESLSQSLWRSQSL